MNPTLKAGIVIGILCALWTLIIGLTGWYKNPVLLNLFWVVILIQVLVLIWGLRKTAAQGKNYWQQVGAGTLMSVYAGIILFIFSILFTTVLFPNYFNELRAMQETLLREAGKTEAEITSEIAITSRMQTPFMQAFSGLLGTVFTGFIASLIIGIFIRNKEEKSDELANKII